MSKASSKLPNGEFSSSFPTAREVEAFLVLTGVGKSSAGRVRGIRSGKASRFNY